MNNYLKLWKSLKKEMGLKNIFDALIGSIVFSIFIIVPMILIYAQLISMYYHLLNMWVILMIVSFVAVSCLQLWLMKKAIVLKTPDIDVNLKSLFLQQMIIDGLVIVVVGLLFIFIWIPNLQV